jgi:hypothetical protein
MDLGGGEMHATLQENPSCAETALILVFVAIDIIALLLAVTPQIASMLSSIAN